MILLQLMTTASLALAPTETVRLTAPDFKKAKAWAQDLLADIKTFKDKSVARFDELSRKISEAFSVPSSVEQEKLPRLTAAYLSGELDMPKNPEGNLMNLVSLSHNNKIRTDDAAVEALGTLINRFSDNPSPELIESSGATTSTNTTRSLKMATESTKFITTKAAAKQLNTQEKRLLRAKLASSLAYLVHGLQNNYLSDKSSVPFTKVMTGSFPDPNNSHGRQPDTETDFVKLACNAINSKHQPNIEAKGSAYFKTTFNKTGATPNQVYMRLLTNLPMLIYRVLDSELSGQGSRQKAHYILNMIQTLSDPGFYSGGGIKPGNNIY